MKIRIFATAIASFSVLGLSVSVQAQSLDAAYIAEFKRYALVSPPDVRSALIGDINRRPDLKINSAIAVCEDLAAGATGEPGGRGIGHLAAVAQFFWQTPVRQNPPCRSDWLCYWSGLQQVEAVVS